MIKSLKYLAGAAVLMLAVACETDLKVNGDYTETAIVYGILDKDDSVHVIKINKTFLGDGNALDFAKIADSSEMKFSARPIVQRIIDGKVFETYELRDTIIGGKPNGTFYSGDSKYYYFVEPNLFPEKSSFYTLSFAHSGKTVTAKSVVINKSTQTAPSVNNSSFELIRNDISTGAPDYTNVAFKAIPGVNSKSLQVKVKFSYLEQYNNGTPDSRKVIEIASAVLTNPDPGAPKEITNTFDSQSMSSQINSQVAENSAVLQRKIENIDIEIIGIGVDLDTYIQVNNPTSGVLQERPEYTNVNNGVGIFSSKYEQTTSKPVGDRTSEMIVRLFQGKKFCSTRTAHNSDPDLFCK